MRKNFVPKPYLYPQPVLIIATYGEDGTPDAMNAAWGGIRQQPCRYVSKRGTQDRTEHSVPKGFHCKHGGRGPCGGV